MEEKELYQTLENRSEIQHIIDNAPFICNWSNTWLGTGYYFWDTFIDNAHWWGEIRYKKNYIITKFICDFSSSTCFDLVSNARHLQDFNDVLSLLREKGILDECTTVARVLAFLRDTGSFDYEAVRAYGVNSISETNKKYSSRMKFELGKKQYLDYLPAWQVCIFEKKGLNLRDIQIVYGID